MANIIPYTLLAWFMIMTTTVVAAPRATTTSDSNRTTTAYTEFIKTWCNTTENPTLCYQYLSPYALKVRSDPLKLCEASLTVSIQVQQNASYVVNKWHKSKGLTEIDNMVLSTCVVLMGDGIYGLNKSIEGFGKVPSSEFKYLLDDAESQLTAAMTDNQWCTDDLKRYKVNETLKNQVESSVFRARDVTMVSFKLIINIDKSINKRFT